MPETRVSDSYDGYLERLLSYGPEYAGELSNHGPMALEALLSLDRPDAFAGYVDLVVQKLEPTKRSYNAADDWRQQVRQALPDLIALAGAQAGHGLLRVGHAVRALERADTLARRRELTAALAYWGTGAALEAPIALTGSETLIDMTGQLPRLSPEQKSDGLLIHNLEAAAALPRVAELISQLAPDNDIEAQLQDLAEIACAAETANHGTGAFALLHGVTVPMVASTLLKYLDDAGRRRLEAAVVGFVVAAIVGFDEASARFEPSHEHAGSERGVLALAAGHAVATGDDHDIKYVEASTRLFEARPGPVPITALARRFDL